MAGTFSYRFFLKILDVLVKIIFAKYWKAWQQLWIINMIKVDTIVINSNFGNTKVSLEEVCL